MKEVGHALFLAIVLSIAREKASAEGNTVIERKEEKMFAIFRNINKDNVLKGHVISTYLVHSELDCLHKCLMNPKCLSLNFQLLSVGSSHVCELNDATRLHGLTFCNGCSYLEPLVLPNLVRDKAKESPLHAIESTQNSAASPAQHSQEGMPFVSTVTSLIMSPALLPPSTSTAVQLTMVSSTGLFLPKSSTMSTLPITSSAILVPPSSTMTSPAGICSVTSQLQMSPSSVMLSMSSVTQLADCAAGWHQFRTGCIKFFTTSLTRMKAKEKCNEFKTFNQIKGALIKIPSSDDNDQVVSLSPTSGRYYIGLSDWFEEGVYRWRGETDKATYVNWKPGYPLQYNIEQNRDCVVISTNPSDNYKMWTTVECSNSWHFICECESACS